jgi:hypothetical protein
MERKDGSLFEKKDARSSRVNKGIAETTPNSSSIRRRTTTVVDHETVWVFTKASF